MVCFLFFFTQTVARRRTYIFVVYLGRSVGASGRPSSRIREHLLIEFSLCPERLGYWIIVQLSSSINHINYYSLGESRYHCNHNNIVMDITKYYIGLSAATL